jgi:hypothetical protein
VEPVHADDVAQQVQGLPMLFELVSCDVKLVQRLEDADIVVSDFRVHGRTCHRSAFTVKVEMKDVRIGIA